MPEARPLKRVPARWWSEQTPWGFCTWCAPQVPERADCVHPPGNTHGQSQTGRLGAGGTGESVFSTAEGAHTMLMARSSWSVVLLEWGPLRSDTHRCSSTLCGFRHTRLRLYPLWVQTHMIAALTFVGSDTHDCSSTLCQFSNKLFGTNFQPRDEVLALPGGHGPPTVAPRG